MSRLEDLLAQIFERKDRIVHRLGQQVESYNESVAINFAATGGGTPPPWLWNPGAGSEALAWSLPQGFGCPFPSSSGCPPVGPEFPLDRNSDVVFSVGDLRQNVDMNPVFMAPSIKNDVDACVRQPENNVSNMEHIVGENPATKCCTSRDENAEGYSGCKTRSIDSSVKLDFEKGMLRSGICSGRVTRSRKLSAQLGTENQLLGSNDRADRVKRSKTLSAKLELEKRSLHAMNLADSTNRNEQDIHKSRPIKIFQVKESVTSFENAAKVSNGGHGNDNQDRILQDLSNKVLSGSKRVTSKNANMGHFPAKDGLCNNSIGCITRSRNSSVKLDFEKQSANAKKGAIFPVEYGHAVDKSSSTGNFLAKVIDEVNDAHKNDMENENAGYNFIIKDVRSKVPLRVEHTDMHGCTQGSNESSAQTTNTGHSKGYCLSYSGNNRKVMTAVDDKSSVTTFTDSIVVQHERKTDASPMQDSISEAKYFSMNSFSQISGSAKSVSDYAEMISSGKNAMPLDEQELGASNGEKVELDECSIEQTVTPGEYCNPSELEQCITRDSTGNGTKVGSVSFCLQRSELLPDGREDVHVSGFSGSLGEHVPQKNVRYGDAKVDFPPSEGQYFLRSSMRNDNAASLNLHGSDDSNFGKRKAIPCACNMNMTWPKSKRLDYPVDDVHHTLQGLRPKPLQNANQCRPRSSVYTSECTIDFHHFCMPKKSTHQIVNSTQSIPFENVQKEMLHRKIENVATDITNTIPDLEVNHSCHDVDLFHTSMSAPMCSNFSSYKDEMEDGVSSKQVNLSSQMCDGTTINEAVLHSEEKGEVITGISGAVPDLMKHRASNGDIDLLCRHTSQLIDSDRSIDFAGAIQNGRSCGEEDFFSQIGDTSANLVSISHEERKEGKEITGDTFLTLRNKEILDYGTDNAGSVHLGHSGGEMEDKIPCSEVNFSSNGSFRSMHQEKESLGVPVQMSSKLEGSSIGTSSKMVGYDFLQNSQFLTSALDTDRLLEKLNTSTAVMTPNCFSSKHEIHKISEASHFLPDDFLLHSHFTNFLNVDDVRQHWTSEYGKMFDTCKSVARNGSTQIVPNSQHLFSTGSLFGSDTQWPFTPPIEKYPHKRNTSKSGSSSGHMTNPELICFRIDENASITGEEIVNELEEIPQQRVSSSEVVVSANNKTLTDMTSLVQNAPSMLSTSQKCLDRGSLDSVSTEADMEFDRNDIRYIVNTNIHSKRSRIERKNQSLSASMKKACGNNSLQNKLGETKPSLRVRNQHKCQASARKGASNIVSNVSSFIPLIQQKQQTAALLNGKRDIKVKALEAAEAAKRQIEKREKDRKMKKEAVMVERKRLEEEKLRNAEQERKKKEEEKRKKEAQIAARKRQREEDEKKEKRAKQRRAEPIFRQHKEQDRICAEDKYLHPNVPEHEKEQMEEERRKCLTSVNILEPAEVNQNISVKCCQGISDTLNIKSPNGKMRNSSTMNEEACNQLTGKDSRESQSYEISPYFDSDVEDEDGIPRRKPIPFWARRESLDHLLHSQRHMDARNIFGCRSSFRLNKVLSVRQRPRPLFAQI